ncbi:protein kinase [Acidobacteriota bacterium]
MKCPKCQTENPDTVKFCGECGTNITSAGDAQPFITKTIETQREELTTGSTFAGRYQIIEELGKGGMGKVYRVLDKKLNEEVALKLIKPDIASDKNTIERFKNELKLARKIRQKNVGSMYELLEDDGIHFITMEYVSGQDLKGLIRQTGQLTVGKAISIAKQICDGLSEAHSLGVVHRDLKPNNIMIDRGGNAKIMDFGIARAVKGKSITGPGIMIGTPQYMSPEQVEGKDIDQRSDIYSLGIILYEMLTERVPFDGDIPLTVGVKQKTEIPKAPKDFNEGIPDDLNRMVLKCLEKERENRYASSDELRSDLERIEQGHPAIDRVKPKKKPLTSKEVTVAFNLKKLFVPAMVFLIVVAALYAIFLGWGSNLNPNSVVVAEFLNQTRDPDLDPLERLAAETVLQGLERIGSIEVVPLARFDLGPNDILEDRHFRKIAKDSDSAIVVSGEYYLQGDSLSFHSIVYDALAQKYAPSPDAIAGLTADPSRALEELCDNLMSVVVSIHDPRMAMWRQVSSYAPKYEALVEFIKGMDFFFRGRREDSIEYSDRAAEIDPDYPLPLFLSALAHGNADRFSVVAQYLDKIDDLPSLSQGEIYFYDWLRARQEGDNESRFRIMEQQEALAPGTMQSYELGVEALFTNRPKLALKAFARLDPESALVKDWFSYWLSLTTAHHMIGNFKQELKDAQKAQKQFPQHWGPLACKIKALAAFGRLEEVHNALDESYAKPITADWYPARLMGIAGEEFSAHGYDDMAAEMFGLGLSWVKNRPLEEGDYRFALTLSTAYALNWQEAEPLFKDLYESDPESLTTLGYLGLCSAKTGDRGEAHRISEVLANWSKPYAFGSHSFWRAVIAAALGEKDRAVSLLRASLQQGQAYSDLYCRMELEPLWDYPAFVELIKPRD